MKLSIFSVAAALVMAVGGVAQATQFMAIDFNSDTTGAAPSTGVTSGPITKIGALGGYTATDYNSPPTVDNGSILVGNVAGMSKAAVLTTNASNAEVGALFMDTGLGLVSTKVGVTFDIAVLAAPPVATSQFPYSLDGGPSNSGVLFGLRTYASDVGQWAFSFAVVPTSSTGGVFALRDITNTQLTSFGSYVNGQKYSIALSSDYSTGTVDAYVNGTLGTSGYPLRTGVVVGPTTTSELFMYFNGESGYANSVAVDNINGFDTAVPEPASLAVLGLGAVAVLARRRRQA
jgi:hypothetical protein